MFANYVLYKCNTTKTVEIWKQIQIEKYLFGKSWSTEFDSDSIVPRKVKWLDNGDKNSWRVMKVGKEKEDTISPEMGYDFIISLPI